MDNLTVLQRKKTMSNIRSKDSFPECQLRKTLHKFGFRYRKNVTRLPGKPDIVLAKYKTVIFVNGCFWHQHPNCIKAVKPKSNNDYWTRKLQKNIERDKKNIEMLESMGWKVLVAWECEINKDFKNLLSFIFKKLKQDS